MRAWLTLFLTVLATSAYGQILPGAYVGVGGGLSRANFACSLLLAGAACDQQDPAWKLFGGYQFNANAAVELGYANLGRVRAASGAGTADAETKAWELAVLVELPVAHRLDALGRLGAYSAQNTLSGAGSGSRSSRDLTFGAGLQYNLSDRLQVRGEWQRYPNVKSANDVAGTVAQSDIDVFGLTLVLRFH